MLNITNLQIRVLVALLAIFLSVLHAQQGIKVIDLQLFAAGSEAPPREQRVYRQEFRRNSTRYVWCELHIRNLLWGVRSQSCNICWRYYDSRNETCGQVTGDFLIKPTRRYSHISHGWGWEQPGKWPPGKYRIEIWIEKTRIDAEYFVITDKQVVPQKVVPRSPQPKVVDKQFDQKKKISSLIQPSQPKVVDKQLPGYIHRTQRKRRSHARSSKTSVFPVPQRIASIKSPLVHWVIQNHSKYSLRISCVGPDKRTITIYPQKTRLLFIRPGRYAVRAYSGQPRALPYTGEFTLQSAHKYLSNFADNKTK